MFEKYRLCVQLIVKKMRRKSFFMLNILVIILITSYLILSNNIESNQSTQSPFMLTVNEFSINETLNKILAIDRSIEESVKRIKRANDSRLVYPEEVIEITKLTISKSECTQKLGKDLLLLIMVLNRVEDFDRRKTIRNSWGKDFINNNKSKLYFAVGLSDNKTIQNQLLEEDIIHNDIIQWSYYESYYNCTIKVLGMLRWTALNCPLVKFMMKADDDSLLVCDNLLKFCDQTVPNAIYGHLWKNPKVFRNITSKWAINTEDYPHYYYPNFIGGPWIIPGSTALTLYKTAITQTLPAIPFEDVYITGIVSQKLNIDRKLMKGHLYLDSGLNCDINDLDLCWYYHYSVFWQSINDTSMMTFYNKLNSFNTNSCSKLSFHYIYSFVSYYYNLIFKDYKPCISV